MLELILRLCDRAGIQVIPAVQFSAPLPELEALRLAGGHEALGLEPIGPDGRRGWPATDARRGMGVYYNALDDRVQRPMQGVVAELAERYGQHASFGGVAIQWTADSYAILPDETCSYDDATIAQFRSRKRALSIPIAMGGRAADAPQPVSARRRREGLAGLASRAARRDVPEMHARAGRVRNDGQALSAAGRSAWPMPQIQQALRPHAAAGKDDAAAVFLMLGIDLPSCSRGRGSSLPRPYRWSPGAPREQHRSSGIGTNQRDLDALFARRGLARQPCTSTSRPRCALPAFDRVSPFGADKTFTWLLSQISPAGAANRERLVHSIAVHDSPLLIDGGWLLPLGQEEALAPLVKVFRRLPAEPFATAQAKTDAARQRNHRANAVARHENLVLCRERHALDGQRRDRFRRGPGAAPRVVCRRAADTTIDDLPSGAHLVDHPRAARPGGGELNSGRAAVVDFRSHFLGDPQTELAEACPRRTRVRTNALPRTAAAARRWPIRRLASCRKGRKFPAGSSVRSPREGGAITRRDRSAASAPPGRANSIRRPVRCTSSTGRFVAAPAAGRVGPQRSVKLPPDRPHHRGRLDARGRSGRAAAIAAGDRRQARRRGVLSIRADRPRRRWPADAGQAQRTSGRAFP